MARDFADRSVGCYFCGKQFDERDGENADEYNNGNGGSICPDCIAKQFTLTTGIIAYICLKSVKTLDDINVLLNMDATCPDNPVSFINAAYFFEQMKTLEDRELSSLEKDTLKLLQKIASKIDQKLISDIQFLV